VNQWYTGRVPHLRDDVRTQEQAGVRSPDPQAWLVARDDAVRAWQAEQNATTEGWLIGTGNLEHVRHLVDSAIPRTRVTVPRRSAGRTWSTEGAPGEGGVRILLDEGEGPRVVLDSRAFGTGEPAVLTWWSVSPDGEVLAAGLCTDGSERSGIHLIDVGSGAALPGPDLVVADAWTGGVQWLRDASGFFVTALVGDPHDFRHGLFRWDRATGATTPQDLPELDDQPDYLLASVARDGRWVVGYRRLMRPLPVALLDLDDPQGAWQPLITHGEHAVAGHVVDGALLAITDLDAPNGRLVRIPLDAGAADPTAWTTLLPESDAVLRNLVLVGDLVYLHQLRDAWSEVIVLTADGSQVDTVPLPGHGVVNDEVWPLSRLTGATGSDAFTFAFSTPVSSWAVYRHAPGDADITLVAPSAATIPGATVEERWVTSTDGARVPYRVVRPAGSTGPGPVLVSAYGGYNVCWHATYPLGIAAFVAAGGTFVHAHIRGGGELGARWWQGGRMQHKQQCYDDLYAVTEDLLAAGVAERGRLALTGGSNGGLMCGVALTQRPELFRAVVPRMPLLDLVGACAEPYGRLAVSVELGDPDDPGDVRRLLSYSPYQQVRPGTAYPAVYLDAGDNDPRCPPWHARKMAAALQEATTSGHPVLLRVWDDAGHGWAAQRELEVDQDTAWLTFVMTELGMLT